MSTPVAWWRPERTSWAPRAPVAVATSFGGVLVLSWVSTWAAVAPYGAPALWLPLGFAVGMLLLSQGARSGWVLLGLGAGTWLVAATAADVAPAAALVLALVNIVEALAIALPLRLADASGLSRPRDIFALAVIALPVTVVASLVVFPFLPQAWGTGLPLVTAFLALSDTAAILVVAPAMLAWRVPSALPRRSLTERLALDLSVVTVLAVVFLPRFAGGDLVHAAMFLPLPVLTWFAVRRGLRPTAVMLPPAMLAVVAASVRGLGTAAIPEAGSPVTAALVVDAFVLATALLLYAIATLVEDRERDVASLRQGDALVRAVAERSGAVVFVKRYEPGAEWGTYVWANDRLVADDGRRGAELLGRRDDEIYDADRAARLRDTDRRVLATGSPVTTEEAGDATAPDQAFLTTTFPLPVAAEVWVAGISTDITDQRRREQEIAVSHGLVRAMFDRSPLATLRIVDPGPGRPAFVAAANPAVAALMRVPVDTLLGADPLASIHPDDRARFERLSRAVRDGMGTESASTHDLRLRRSDGAELLVEATIAPIVGAAHRPGDPVEFVVHLEDVTLRRVTDEITSRRARRDAVTGLLNRHAILDVLERQVVSLRTEQGSVTVVYVDLDDFKAVNDRAGHAHGDEVLRTVGEALLRAVGSTDAVGRIGGDEFVVVATRRDPEGVPDLARSVQLALGARLPLPDPADRCTASVGVVVVTDPALSVGEVLRRADWAMYRAKSAGKDRAASFDVGEERTAAARAAQRVSDDVAGVTAVYQPIVSLTDGRVVGLEAYARVPSLDGGPGSPVGLLAEALSAGVVGPLDDRMLALSTAAAAGWRSTGNPWGVSVNLDPAWLARPGAAERVLDLAAAAGLPPNALTVELPLSAGGRFGETAVAAMMRLRSAGVHVALDHVDPSLADLADLGRLPMDRVKLAPAVVTASDRPGAARDQVLAVVAVTERLDIPVTAEGVETEQVAGALRMLGVDWAQGYLWQEPAPLAAVLQAALV